MGEKTLNYAKENIDFVFKEDGIKSFIDNGRLWIVFQSGRNLELSEREILYNATEYLER